MTENTWLIVGLGNPGSKYQQNWHNLGFMAIDYMSQYYQIKLNKTKFNGHFGQGYIGAEKVIFLQPQTYMNNSGESVRDFMNYFKLKINHLVVIYDDLDIKVGSIRIREQGSGGTHNGMRSILRQLKNQNFPRIRIGMGPKPNHIDLISYVLKDIAQDKKEEVFTSLQRVAYAIEFIIQGNTQLAMSRYNGENPSGEV